MSDWDDEYRSPAKPEYATAKIAVWWDMKECPIPEGYDARWVRPSIQGAFKKLGYSGPVSITAYGDQTQSPGHVLRGLSSTGVAVAHTRSECTCSFMYKDMVEWRGHNPPPATMMIISNQVEDVFSWDLVRLQQRTTYNLFLAYLIKKQRFSGLLASAEWLWEKLLDYNKVETRSAPHKCSETSAMLHCKSCNFDAQSPQKFRNHLSSYHHARKEAVFSWRYTELIPVTKTWARNYPATPEFATAKIAVWWVMTAKMFDCPIPEGYDARRVRPSLEAAFKNLGYSGPVSITAYADLNHTPDHILRALSSTGVDVAHTFGNIVYSRMISDFSQWAKDNPHPATLMFVADTDTSEFGRFTRRLVELLQREKRNLFIAYSFRPRKMSSLITSAEWLWESLLAVTETTRHVLRKCSTVSETRRHVLRKCSGSETDSACASTAMFYCRICFFDRKDDPDYKSLDDFRTHLSSEDHALEENLKTVNTQRREQLEKLCRLYDFEDKHSHWYWREVVAKNKRMSKAFRTGFPLLDNHLRLKRMRKRLKRMRKAFPSRLCNKYSRLEYRAWSTTVRLTKLQKLK